MARPMNEADHRIGPNGDVNQMGISDELQIAAGTRRNYNPSLVKEL
jgi:hypothetical protein